MAKRLASRGIKKHQSYTLEEAALILGVHVQTVRSWERRGLPIMRGQRPHLVHGADLKSFLEKHVRRAKRSLKPNEVYCLRCRDAVRPAGDLADYISNGEGNGRLSGICPRCEGMAHRFVSTQSIRKVAPDLLLEFEGGEESLTGSDTPPSKTHNPDRDQP